MGAERKVTRIYNPRKDQVERYAKEIRQMVIARGDQFRRTINYLVRRHG